MTEYQLLVIICISDIVSSIFLMVEYFWGRPDIALKNEANQKKRLREKHNFTELTQGEHR